MQKLWTIIACTIASTSSYIMSMEQNIIPTEFTQQQMDLTKALYQKTLTPDTLKELYQKGAVINGKTPKYRTVCGRLDYHGFEPLSHWVVSFNIHHKDENPWDSNAYYTTNFSNLSGKKTVKDVAIIAQLLELGAQPTKEFKQYYFDLLQYNMNVPKKNIAILLLKSKPTDMNEKELKKIWEYTLNTENRENIDLLMQYFTPSEIKPGIDYSLDGYIAEPWKTDHLENLKILCNNGAFTEKSLKSLEELLEENKRVQALYLSIIDLMKKNKLNSTSSTKEH